MKHTHLETKPVTQRVKLDKAVKQYIIEAIEADNYEIRSKLDTEQAKLIFLYETFKKEYSHAIKLYGEYKAFSEWLQDLPSCFNIEFRNYQILELARSWGSISPDLTGKALERREELIISNWFNFITVKTFQLFRKHGVN